MRFRLLLLSLLLLLSYISLSQKRDILSNLENLVLNLGDSFTPETLILNSDGSTSQCENLIYYNKKGVFNVGNSIYIDPNTGNIIANEPGLHEVVVLCVDINNGNRLSKTFNVRVNYSKVSSLMVDLVDHEYVGNFISYSYKIKTENDVEVLDAYPTVYSSNPEIVYVDNNYELKAMKKGIADLTFEFDDIKYIKKIEIIENPVSSLFIYSEKNKIKTGDVLELKTVMYDSDGKEIKNLNPSFTYSGISIDKSTTASAYISNNKFVTDTPGNYLINASFGNLTNSLKIKVFDRNIKKDIVKLGSGNVFNTHTSDAWFFEGEDGRDYGISGTWGYNGIAYFWDITNPENIIKIDSIKVDARIVNDVKVSKDGKIAVLAREGASNRKNGIIILDVSDMSNIKILSEYSEGITGGVHNVFIYENHIYALNAYAGPSKFDVINIDDPKNPSTVGVFQLGDGSAIHDIWIEDGIAYTSNWKDGVYLVDVGNGIAGGSPKNPVSISNYKYATGGTHAAFPFKSKSTGKFYVVIGDEIFPDGLDGFSPNRTEGYLHFIDFTDFKNPIEVARYELPGHGSHNFWIENDIIYAAMYTGGVRVIDVSGDLLGDLFKQGREIAFFNTGSKDGFVSNSPMTWGAQFFKGNIFYSDFNTGIGALKLLDSKPDNSNVNQVINDKTFQSALGVKNILELFEYIASPPVNQ